MNFDPINFWEDSLEIFTAAEALRSRGLVVGSRQEGRRRKKEEGRDKTLNKPLESSKGCWPSLVYRLG